MLLLSQKRYHSESYCVKIDLLCIVIQAILNRYNASNSVVLCVIQYILFMRI